MNKKAPYSLVNHSTIQKAQKGDIEAMNSVLLHYQSYIIALSYRPKKGVGSYVDEELRQRLESKLISAILSFREE